jgi:hypothetical protein
MVLLSILGFNFISTVWLRSQGPASVVKIYLNGCPDVYMNLFVTKDWCMYLFLIKEQKTPFLQCNI